MFKTKRRKWMVLLLALATVPVVALVWMLAGCQHIPMARSVASTRYPHLVDEERVVFAVMGDTGDCEVGVDHLCKSPHPLSPQLRVAKAMKQVCAKEHCRFGVMLGDNFYVIGALSNDDWRFRFDAVYNKAGPNIPFWVALGNHDWIYPKSAQLELEWSEEGKRNWLLPSVHYAVPALPSWLRLYALDSSLALGMHGDSHSVAYLNTDEVEHARTEMLKQAPAFLCQHPGWHIVFAHHPPLSSGAHGYRDKNDLKKIRKFYGVINEQCPLDLLLAGHDHHQEHLQVDGYDVVVQGAGGRHLYHHQQDSGDPSREESRFYEENRFGFSIVTATKSELEVKYYDDQANELYRFTRHQAPPANPENRP